MSCLAAGEQQAIGLHGWLAELGSCVQHLHAALLLCYCFWLLMSHPAETDGGYSANYLLFGIDPSAAADIRDFQAVRE